VAEAVGVVAGLHDVAVVGEAVEQCRGHLGIGEDAGPLGEAQVGGNHDAGVLVELGEQMKEQGPARLAEGQVAELIEDD